MFIGALISLLAATVVGALYMLAVYLSLRTVQNCQFYPRNSTSIQTQWIRSMSDVISCAFLYIWFFVLFTPLLGIVPKALSRICAQRFYNITHPGFSYVLLSALYFGSVLIFRVLQADLENLESIAILGIIHGAAEVIERSTMVVIDHICHMVWKRTSAPWESFRTPRRERLMADIAIMGMLSESTAIVSVNEYLYLYQFIFLKNKPPFDLIRLFAIHTSVSLVIEWAFTTGSIAIARRYQNIAVLAVWRRRWKRHILVSTVYAVPVAMWTSTNLLVIVYERFRHASSVPCKMPFT